MTTDGASAMAARRLRITVLTVALLNLGYFLVEVSVAVVIGSVSLMADSVDFLEDTSVNVLVLLALGLSARRRRLVAYALAALLVVPALVALWMVWQKLAAPSVPAAEPLTLAAAGALVVNLVCALLLARVRASGGSLSLAAYLSARNDVAANFGIIVAGLLTGLTGSMWPDLVLGLVIVAINITAAREVLEAADEESELQADQAKGPQERLRP
ncbi:MAG: cation transporter [Pseudomonadota bacterium]